MFDDLRLWFSLGVCLRLDRKMMKCFCGKILLGCACLNLVDFNSVACME